MKPLPSSSFSVRDFLVFRDHHNNVKNNSIIIVLQALVPVRAKWGPYWAGIGANNSFVYYNFKSSVHKALVKKVEQFLFPLYRGLARTPRGIKSSASGHPLIKCQASPQVRLCPPSPWFFPLLVCMWWYSWTPRSFSTRVMELHVLIPEVISECFQITAKSWPQILQHLVWSVLNHPH